MNPLPFLILVLSLAVLVGCGPVCGESETEAKTRKENESVKNYELDRRLDSFTKKFDEISQLLKYVPSGAITYQGGWICFGGDKECMKENQERSAAPASITIAGKTYILEKHDPLPYTEVIEEKN